MVIEVISANMLLHNAGKKNTPDSTAHRQITIETTKTFDDLPGELVASIFSYLPCPRDLCSAEETCRWWREIMRRNDGGVTCWRQLIINQILPRYLQTELKNANLRWLMEWREKLSQPGAIFDRQGDDHVPLSLSKSKKMFQFSSRQPLELFPPGMDVLLDRSTRIFHLDPSANHRANRSAKANIAFSCNPGLTKLVPHANDEGKWALSTDRPYYFEIQVTPQSKSCHKDECLAIGLGTPSFPTRGDLPGWKASIGYHGDDGRTYISSGNSGIPFGPKFGEIGDVVGCGLDPIAQQVFFTLNGELIGGFPNLEDATLLYPIVGVGTYSELHWNFGIEPFVYNLWDYKSHAVSADNQDERHSRVGFSGCFPWCRSLRGRSIVRQDSRDT